MDQAAFEATQASYRARLWRWAIWGLFVFQATVGAGAAEPEGTNEGAGLFAGLRERISLPARSLDKVIAWTDQYYFHQWRIQAHVETGECRLLDDNDKLRLEGSFDDCLAELKSIKRAENLPPMEGNAVVLLHGLGAPRWSMHLLARYLEKHGEYATFAIDYASLRSNIDDQASSLANVIRSLKGIKQIDLVGHSLGNIVIRRYLAGNSSAPHVWKPDPRIHRIVMIAPPNHGSLAASRLAGSLVFKTIFGKSGGQLGESWNNLEERLATPEVEFGIIAGGVGNSIGLNPILPGDDDGRITVETTRLAGATDFRVVPALHELIANDPRVFKFTLRFLEKGYFVSRDEATSLQSTARRPDLPSR
ncbi:MAG: esterase/lipase family protein [Planctomycetota bacterium]